MSDEYTPSVEAARERYWAASGHPRRGSASWAEFDRMIAAVKADAIEEVAESSIEGGMVHRRLLDVAATYRTPSTTHGEGER